MRKVIICKGLPASGKSTWCKELVTQNPQQYKRINKDDLRAMLDNSHFSNGNENFILKIRDFLIIEALKDGKNVLIDDTNLHPKHEARIREIVTNYNQENNAQISVQVKFFDISLEEAIARDLKRFASVGEAVIKNMYYQFLAPPLPNLEQDKNLIKAVIVDIDGTLAQKGDRSPFDWRKVLIDTPITPVVSLVKTLEKTGYKILIFSGRDEICLEETKTWLALQNINYELLCMRPQADNRKDSLIKKELFEKFVAGKYFVEFVIDDRKQVKRMWTEELGLFVFDVNQRDLEF